ncbi:MAG: ESX-1 secretion-associated protein [Mycobacteriaceae bacterium]|nr:ESX-1 secretion-associated protein [Mycobacteriaceae bacterium]
MAPLEVTTSFLKNNLSVALKTAAEYLQSATDIVPGTWSLSWDNLVNTDGSGFPHHTWLWVSHGVVCHQSNAAIEKAEDVRCAAGNALVAVATYLTETVRRAAESYANTDLKVGRNLDNLDD